MQIPPLSIARRLGCIALLLARGGAWGADWPSWRGPDQNGVSRETNAPLQWSRTQNVRWIHRLREPGNSTPIVLGDTVFLTQSLGIQRSLLAINRRSGRARWAVGEESRTNERTERSNPYCSPSPVTDGERVFCWFGSVGLVAYGLDGRKLWHADLGPQRHQFGYGASPILHENKVILSFGPGVQEFVVALDARTGRELWRVSGPEPGRDDTYGTWSTPFVTEVGGKPQVLVALRDYFAGLDPITGTEIWRSRGLGLQAKSSPIADGRIAVISGDLRGAEIAVRLGGKGDVTETHRLWKENPPRRRVATGVIVDGRAYGAQASGLIDCIDLESGDIVWAERMSGAGANGAIWASPILVGDRLYFHNQGGDTAIIAASPRFRQLAVNSIGEPGNASPVVAYGDLFLRTHVALWCIREPDKSPPSANP
ncbi:MAG: PQQ-binding-like beta-propeller repeat protein [Limisphaerales bacterium]